MVVTFNEAPVIAVTTTYSAPEGVSYCPSGKTTGWVTVRLVPDANAWHYAQTDDDKRTDVTR